LRERRKANYVSRHGVDSLILSECTHLRRNRGENNTHHQSRGYRTHAKGKGATKEYRKGRSGGGRQGTGKNLLKAAGKCFNSDEKKKERKRPPSKKGRRSIAGVEINGGGTPE